MRPVPAGSLLLAALLGSAAAAAGAQEAQPPPQVVLEGSAPVPIEEPRQTFFEELQVGVAEVEVVVLDREGRRVTDLRREQFAVYEDGERVEILSFLPPAGGAAAPAAVATPAATAPLLAIFVDNQSLTMTSRRRMLEALRERLAAGLPGGCRVMVAAQDTPGSLRVLLAPTSDPAAIQTALDATAAVVPAGTLHASNVVRLLREIEVAARPPDDEASEAERAHAEAQARSVHDEIRIHALESGRQAAATATALAQLVEGLAGLPGRKVALVVSGGLSLRPAQALMEAWDRAFARADQDWDISEPFDWLEGGSGSVLADIAEHANGNQVTLYALGATDVPGFATVALRTGEVWSEGSAQLERANARLSLEELVRPTGGLASVDGTSPERLLEDIAGDLGGVYSIAYDAPRRAAGSRRVRVDVAVPGLTVRHRATRRERSGRELMVDRTRAGLLFGWQDNPLGVAVEAGATTPGTESGTAVLPLTVELPMSGLVLVPKGDFHEGRLTIYFAASDASARLSAVNEVIVPVRVPNEQLLAALGQLATYRTRLAVRDARQTIVVSVRDELANVSSTVLLTHPPAPASTDAAAPAAEPPPGHHR